jgi:hypothetical protein
MLRKQNLQLTCPNNDNIKVSFISRVNKINMIYNLSICPKSDHLEFWVYIILNINDWNDEIMQWKWIQLESQLHKHILICVVLRIFIIETNWLHWRIETMQQV